MKVKFSRVVEEIEKTRYIFCLHIEEFRKECAHLVSWLPITTWMG